jgi:uncharacterized radical SAM superfamily Fe-S cluster-containing enzyme
MTQNAIRKNRPYIFYAQTQSLCEECLAVVPAKIIFQNNQVYYHKRCLLHGAQKTLISTDIDYFLKCKQYLKPGDMPRLFQTEINKGCPHDCGLCPDHEQHSCLAIFEINDECNLKCPTCYAGSAPGMGNYRSMAEIERMLATLIASETEPDLLQISGGEPTLHPQILEILHRLKDSPVRHLMLNTNGIRIANDADFVTELAKIKQGFEVYLQFDSLNRDALDTIRGTNLLNSRQRALAQLEKHNISTTLVCVVQKGVNETEINDIIKHAMTFKCVRGVTFQPVEHAGRHAEQSRHKITLSEIRQAIITGDNPFNNDDMIPLPCHPENICIGYGLKLEDQITAITGMIPKDILLEGVDNTITFEKSPQIKQAFMKLFSLDACSEKTMENLQTMLCCLPKVDLPQLGYDNVFRVVIMEFMDKYTFDLGSIKRSCVHFVEPNGKIYPFETWNMFYRDKLKKS